MWRSATHSRLLTHTLSVGGLGAVQCLLIQHKQQLAIEPHSGLFSRPAVQCAPQQHFLQCTVCDKTLPRDSFSQDQQRRKTRTCSECASARLDESVGSATNRLTCSACGEDLERDSFAKNQQRRSTKICTSCISRAKNPCNADPDSLECTTCHKHCPPEDFSNFQRSRTTRQCKQCAVPGPQRADFSRITLGSQDFTCPHCGATMVPCEGGSFCCGSGKYIINFEEYFRPPATRMIRIFQTTWRHKDSKGNVLHDARI